MMTQLQELYEKATPGRWYMEPELLGPDGGCIWAETPDGDLLPMFEVVDTYPQGDYSPQENCELTVALHNAWPELAALLRDAREWIAANGSNWNGDWRTCNGCDAQSEGYRALEHTADCEWAALLERMPS